MFKIRKNNLLGRKLNNFQSIYIMVIGICLLLFYISSIGKNITIWELNDEAQYLFNASLLAGYDWKEIFSNITDYYGFGYSILLMPLFYICDSGTQLIQSAALLNVFLIMIIYVLQIYVMSKVLPECETVLLAVISAVTCLYPYYVSSSMKVICEAFLTLLGWLIGAVLLKAIEEEKVRYWIVLGILTTFIFFIHARSIATIGAMAITVIVYVLLNKKCKKKYVAAALIVAVLSYVFLSSVKSEMVSLLGTGHVVQKTGNVSNLITGSYITDRLKWLFSPENIAIYFHCAVGKIYYLIVASAGAFLFGATDEIKKIYFWIKNRELHTKNTNYLELFFFLQFIFMIIMCFVVGTGDHYRVFIYGRYYEYTVGFLVFLGIYNLLTKKLSKKSCIWGIMAILLMALVTANLQSFSVSPTVVIDTNRLSGFSSYINMFDDWRIMISYSCVVITVVMGIFLLANKVRTKRFIIMICIMALFLVCDGAIINQIHNTHETLKTDTELANYIEDDAENSQIYFIYEEYKYDSYYSRLQIFLKDKQMHIVYPEEFGKIKENTFIITYKGSDFSRQLKKDNLAECLLQSEHYELFKKSTSN